MKKLFIALTILFCVTGANVSAAPFTESQLEKIFAGLERSETSATFDFNLDKFKETFNGFMTPFLKDATGNDDVSAIAHLFLIRDYKVFNDDGGDIFVNVFGNSVAIVGVSEPNGGNFRTLSCAYTTPEDSDENIFVQLLMTGFVGSVAPDVAVADLMRELIAAGTVTKGGVKFSLTDDGNLNTLTAVPAR